MENGRRKIRICLFGIVLAAVVIILMEAGSPLPVREL